MILSTALRAKAIATAISELEQWIDRDVIPLTEWTMDGMPIRPGDPWPHRNDLLVLDHGQVNVPSDWPLDETRIEIDMTGEGLLILSHDDGHIQQFGMNKWHLIFHPDGRRFGLRAECVARQLVGQPNRTPSLRTARLTRIEPDLDRLVLLLRMIREFADWVPDHDATPPTLRAAERAIAALDWPSATQPYKERIAASEQSLKIWALPEGLEVLPDGPRPPLSNEARASVVAAVDGLRSELRRIRGLYPQIGTLIMSGHAHIDLCWLWPYSETRRKARRTYSTVCDMLDRHPHLFFGQSSAALHEIIEEDDPVLFDRIRGHVKADRWEPIGGLWLEPDSNMPIGEALVRHALYGQRWFEDRFGTRHTVAWLPDVFGFSPALPQILQQAGITGFATSKLAWNETNRFPYDLFQWEGHDGSRVLAHLFYIERGTYNGTVEMDQLMGSWDRHAAKDIVPECLFTYGWGDGGGGPTEAMAQRIELAADFPVIPRLENRRIQDWFEDTVAPRMAEADAEAPVWVGEMYLEIHRGTLTTQGRTKRANRRAERAMIAAETLGCLDALTGGQQARDLQQEWRLLMRNQFHDILPGSSIREVHAQAEDELAELTDRALGEAEARLDAVTRRHFGDGGEKSLLVFNPELSQRPVRVTSTEPFEGAQPVAGGHVYTAPDTVGGLEMRTVAIGKAPDAPVTVDDRTLENAFIRAEFGEDGTLVSLNDKRHNREVLATPSNRLVAYADRPRHYDAWEIDPTITDRQYEIAATSMTVDETGPHRAALRIERQFRNSCIVQSVRLWSNSPRLDFATHIDWHDRRFLLKARFALAIRSESATFECAHGVIRRPTHRNTSWEAAKYEVAAHRFADLSEEGYGVALLNDGRYGHDVLGNDIGISLLRSPAWPDMDADEGAHELTFALFPHAGTWAEGGVLAEAEDLNQPLMLREVSCPAGQTHAPVRIAGQHSALGGLKRAEDGDGMILRLYEPAGARGHVAIELDGAALGPSVTLMEEPDGRDDLALAPFELRSWRLFPK